MKPILRPRRTAPQARGAFQRCPLGPWRSDAFVDRLRHNRGNDRSTLARRSVPHRADHRARTVSHCQPIRPVRRDDPRPLRDRIPGLERRRELDRVSVPQQAAGAERAPRIYAPYQPRFDWNLWFASLGDWRQNEIVPLTEERLLRTAAMFCALSRAIHFQQSPPRYVRAVLWQYWFTSIDEKRRTGNWWRRQFLGLYAPEITLTPEGTFAVVQWPDELPPHD